MLQDLGLNEREAKIYLTLVREKTATAAKIAKSASVNRTTAYLELENLMKQGLVSYVIKDAKRYYQAAPPEKFLDILEQKKKSFETILPLLRGVQNNSQPYKIEVFEGKEGIKTCYQDIYNTAKEFLVFGATGKAAEVLKYNYPHIVEKFIQANIKERALANENAKKMMEEHPKTHMKVKYLPKKYKADVTTIIYAGKVAIQSLQKENIYVVVIKDPLLYSSYKNYFEFMWERI